MISSKPQVSIVCITYNHELFIEKALKGFVSQKTSFDFEVIIADDCSTDNTRSFIEEYLQIYPNIIKPILREKNIGSLPNYHDALSKVQGKYVAICDGDDYWIDEKKLQKQFDFLEKHPDYSMCCHPFIQTFVDHSISDKVISPWDSVSTEAKRRGYLIFEDFFPVNPIGSLSVMYRWKLKYSLPLWMKEYKIGDLVLHLLHADKGKVGVINDVMAVYQRHQQGVWFDNHTKEQQKKFASEFSNLLTDIDFEVNEKYTKLIGPCKGNPLRILFLAMENSIHSYQWIQTLVKENHHIIQLYSSYHIPEKPPLFSPDENFRIYSPYNLIDRKYSLKIYFESLLKMVFKRKKVTRMMENGTFGFDVLIRLSRFDYVKKYIKTFAKMILRPKKTIEMIINGTFGHGKGLGTEKPLDAVIRDFKPDVIHTLHTQTSGYLMMNIRKNWEGNFPVWIHSVWGSDLYLWERIPGQKPILQEFLSYVDYFIGEGKRDEKLAINLGYKGKFIDPMPASGGFDLEKISSLNLIKPSIRKEIAVKGYDHGVGRFRDAIIGIVQAKDVLQDYIINVFSLEMSPDLLNVYAVDSGLRINIIPYGSYDNIVNMFTRSRIYIGCSFSDGVPASFLEAMAYGAFPIQTNTSLADEWVEDGKTGILVPPDDTAAIEKAIRIAVMDDNLVDEAASQNFQTICLKADNVKRRKRIQKMYNTYGYR